MEDVPLSRGVLLDEVNQRLGNVGIIGNELSIEIGKSKERSNVFDFHWSRPFHDAVQLYWVHGKLSWSDNHA